MSLIETTIIDSGRPGPRISILAGVHGNEPCGVRAFASLGKPRLLKGSLQLIIANTQALQQNKRFIDKDLNRSFEEEDDSHEGRIATELKALLESSDALLDLHSSDCDEPYAICRAASLNLAQALPVKKVLTGLERYHKGSSDEYLAQRGKIGICIECGPHQDPQSVAVARQAIKAFLAATGSITGTVQQHEQEVFIATRLYRNSRTFKACQVLKDFSKISKGKLIGTDGQENVLAQHDGYIHFMNNRQEAGQECFIESIKT